MNSFVVCLEIGSLIGDEGVGSRVVLVETVVRELQYEVEYLWQCRAHRSSRPGYELLLRIKEEVQFFFPTARLRISASPRLNPATTLTAEDLFLIHENTVGVFQHRLKERMDNGRASPARRYSGIAA